ncbi:alpha mannosidase-like protein [Thelephora terrestris]|uniref:alpha-1,2-Mannosidase n=1 Tax=Thelephora terrestris TaxID=56493 RepID=A0A9P6H7P9_9AGAM|nr:alpha mannosidase-like protein [Thelephora terrestris]
MTWHSWRTRAFLGFVLLAFQFWPSTTETSIPTPSHVNGWSLNRTVALRERVRDLWYHGFDNYMNHAFPYDELDPLSCVGRGPDYSEPDGWAANDVAGNYSVTLVDALDTFVVLGDVQGFDTAIRNVIKFVTFNVNTRPQVFEATIRVLGGLLSAHIFASRPDQPFHLSWYNNELLHMAHDLGNRLLPAFSTPTGIPYARVHLKLGVLDGEGYETCTAGAGSLILEFATLSRLTGDDRFEQAAYKAFFALWNRRSDIGLVGNTVSLRTGAWLSPEISGIGAGIDSFYEYALKWYVLSGEVEFLDVWHQSYAAVMRYSRTSNGYWFRNVNIHSGDPAYFTIDSLSAFWPGLQVLAGDVENAIKAHLMYWNLWKRFSGMPEVFDTAFLQVTTWQYPLRPEFIESTWYLYRATKDPFYLYVGERVLNDLEARAKVECGLAGISNLLTNTLSNRMESFVLSETLKYLYLLFDEENLLHDDDSNYVFTTEGHILILDPKYTKPMSAVRRKLRGAENHQCPAYTPGITFQRKSNLGGGITGGIQSRRDVEYARFLTDGIASELERAAWSPYGFCDIPKVEVFSYDFVLSHDGKTVTEDPNPDNSKLESTEHGYLIHNITGIRAHIVSRLDGKGYDITRLGPHSVRTGQLVFVDDQRLVGTGDTSASTTPKRVPIISLRFFVDPAFQDQVDTTEDPLEATLPANTALFGGDPSMSAPDQEPIRFGHQDGARLVQDHSNPYGCETYEQLYPDEVLLVNRGECTFLKKLLTAKEAGASGVIVVNDDDARVSPSINEEEREEVGDAVDDVALVVLAKTAGEAVMDMIKRTQHLGVGQVIFMVDPDSRQVGMTKPPRNYKSSNDMDKLKDDTQKVLYLNGHALVNTRLLVV